jgi:tetratricopeptide (TPR) repeat protein
MTFRRALILALLTFAIYGAALQADFVAGDRQFILNNTLAADFPTALQSFIADYWGTLGGESFVYYRPLTVLTHCLDSNLWGNNPAGHHLTNIVLHTIVTLLVFAFFLRLLPHRPLLCFAAALLFGLHPVHTHSVIYVVGRTDVLATLFSVVSLLMLCRKKSTVFQYAAGALCYLAALLCKEIAVTLPLLFGMYCLAVPAGKRPSGPQIRRVTVFLSLALLIYLAARIQAIGLGGPPGADFAYAVWQRLLLVFMTLGFYCVKLLLPLNLCYYSNLVVPYPDMGALDILLTLTGAVCTALMLTFWRRGVVGMMLAWIGITLLPVLNIVTLPVLAKENYLYLPSIGFCLLAVLLISKIKPLVSPRIVALMFAFVLLLYSMQVFLRTVDYRDPAAYLLSAVRVMRPLSPEELENKHYFEGAKNWFTTCRNLGYLFVEKKNPDKAEYWFLRALDHTATYFDPNYAAECHLALGELYLKQGRAADAIAQLTAALNGTYKTKNVYNLLGVGAAMQKNPGEAEAFFLKALEIDPDYASARSNLARLQQQREQLTREPR